MKNLSNLFVDESEKEVAVLGSSFIQNFLSSGDVSKGFCVVSNKRVYFKGKCYYRVCKHFKTTKEERTVDLKDITGTGFSITRNFLLFVMLLISIAWAIFVTITCMSYFGVFQASVAFIPFVVIGIIYFICHVKLFEISFAGGKISFKATDYSQQEIADFQKALRIAKDGCLGEPSPLVNSNSVGDELKKYKELLDSGAITEAEYDNLKRKILN